MSKTRKRILIAVGCVVLIGGLFVASDVMFFDANWGPFRRYHEPVPYVVTTGRLNWAWATIITFKEEKGRFPMSIAELKKFLEITSPDDKRNYAYIDGWSQPLRYVTQNPKLNKGKVDLYSIGPNGVGEYDKEDFGDDIHIMTDEPSIIRR